MGAIIPLIYKQRVSHFFVNGCNYQGKKHTLCTKFEYNHKWIFKPSIFRYNVLPESNHWILWNSEQNFNHDYSDLLINQLISNFIINIIGHDNYQFVWYKNPKPTIPEFFHVQVFWIC